MLAYAAAIAARTGSASSPRMRIGAFCGPPSRTSIASSSPVSSLSLDSSSACSASSTSSSATSPPSSLASSSASSCSAVSSASSSSSSGALLLASSVLVGDSRCLACCARTSRIADTPSRVIRSRRDVIDSDIAGSVEGLARLPCARLRSAAPLRACAQAGARPTRARRRSNQRTGTERRPVHGASSRAWTSSDELASRVWRAGMSLPTQDPRPELRRREGGRHDRRPERHRRERHPR